jgi:hypothetical protein
MVVCDHNDNILHVFIDFMGQVYSRVSSCHKGSSFGQILTIIYMMKILVD